jgi:DNA sulfur modification protein DndE
VAQVGAIGQELVAMSFTRIYVGKDIDMKLRSLKARTGLTPNLLCRLGFCLSLAESGIPDPRLYADGQVREFNRYTLTGQWDVLFLALLKERMADDGLDVADLEVQFKGHIGRGIGLLYQRVKCLTDIVTITEHAERGRR